MLAPSAGTLPRGHVLVEPYLYDDVQYGTYDGRGAVRGTTHTNTFGNLTYVIYGLTDRFSIGVLPTGGLTTLHGGPNSTLQFGDLGVLAQYRLLLFHPGSAVPTTSIAVQETLPTGRYDNLGTNPTNGFGSGIYSTKISLYMQDYAWMPSRRILRMRLNVSETLAGTATVDGVSVYGTGPGFAGTAQPGDTLSIDTAGEYSFTRNWVAAADVVYAYSGATLVRAPSFVTNLGVAHSLAIAPAVEFNWTANAGILLGVRIFPSGRNTAASITPAIAVNMVR